MSEYAEEPELPLPPPQDGEVIDEVQRLTRIFYRGGLHPSDWHQHRVWGPNPNARFDPHREPAADQPDRAVLYAAAKGLEKALHTALAEFFQDTRVIDRLRREPWVAMWRPADPLRLLDLTSAWLTRARGNGAVYSGSRPVSRAWARAIFEQLSELDGLLWPSSVLGRGRAVVLWPSAQARYPANPDLIRPLSDAALTPILTEAANRIGYSLT